MRKKENRSGSVCMHECICALGENKQDRLIVNWRKIPNCTFLGLNLVTLGPLFPTPPISSHHYLSWEKEVNHEIGGKYNTALSLFEQNDYQHIFIFSIGKGKANVWRLGLVFCFSYFISIMKSRFVNKHPCCLCTKPKPLKFSLHDIKTQIINYF